MARNKDAVELRTTLTVEQVKSIFSSTLQGYSRKVEYGAVQPSDNPFDSPVDFQAYSSL